MNRAFLKYFFIIFIIPILCSSCGQNNIIGQNSIIGENFFSAKDNPEAVKYKSGAILLKDNKEETNQKKFINHEEINFGPNDINFERN